MANWVKQMLVKYKELISYGVFGLGATLINIFSFYLFKRIFTLDMVISNILAWVLSFVFAFLSNKLWVFESKNWTSRAAMKEMVQFLVARLATFVLDTVCMWLLIDRLSVNDLMAKISVNILVIMTNYMASKFWVFKK